VRRGLADARLKTERCEVGFVLVSVRIVFPWNNKEILIHEMAYNKFIQHIPYKTHIIIANNF
jgi:hypothetical protein